MTRVAPVLLLGLVAVSIGVAAAAAPFPAVVVAVVVLILAVAATHPAVVAPLLLLAAALFSRPNIFGESAAPVGLALAALAASVALVSDKRSARGALQTGGAARIVVFLALSYGAALLVQPPRTSGLIIAMVLCVGTTTSAVVVLRQPERRALVAKGFILIVGGFALSYLITAGGWLLFGTGWGEWGASDLGGTFYLPFTPTRGSFELLGLAVPRLAGLGREPGWMGMYAAFAYFLAGKIGFDNRVVRALLLVGLIASFSSAALWVFVVFLAYDQFLRGDRSGLVRLVGMAAMVGGLWVAWNAPVIGVAEKFARDPYSVEARLAATEAGVRALLTSPFSGGRGTDVVGSVNLIASVASVGLAYSVLIICALLAPRRGHPRRITTTAPIGVLLLTLATTQPPLGSTWVYVCAAITYTATLPPAMPQCDHGQLGQTESLDATGAGLGRHAMREAPS